MNVAKDASNHWVAIVHGAKEAAWLILTIVISLGPVLVENEHITKVLAVFGVSVVGLKFGIDVARKAYSLFKVKNALDATSELPSSGNTVKDVIAEVQAPVSQDIFTNLGIDPVQFTAQLQAVANYIQSQNVQPNDVQPTDTTNVDPNFVYPTAQ